MSMTREEAIVQIQGLKKYCEGMAGSDESGSYVFDLDVQALDLALAALRPVIREQVEKVWRGKWELVRRMAASIECKCPKCQRTVIFTGNPANFCEKCGSAMTDEALEMVMERINKMEEITDEH